MKTDKIIIFDTTLRDGEQSPGAVLRSDEKLQVAHALEELGVDVIEAGFPVSSDEDFQTIVRISKEIKKTSICALARSIEKDIEIAAKAINQAKIPRIHTFIGVSDIHLNTQLHKNYRQVLKLVGDSVKKANNYAAEVEFSPMDATRSNFEFLMEVLNVAVENGATTLNIPDTVGYALPWEMHNLISRVKKEVVQNRNIVISAHCHQDLGLAVANSLASIRAGARQVECTINGLGERAGNASLEEIAMLLKVRFKDLGFETNINHKHIHKVSKLVSKLTHIPVQPNKAIVGRNAFAHASGIHQDGYLKGQKTYEIMSPKDIGLKSSRIVLSARSGRHALKYRLYLLGYKNIDLKLNDIYLKFLKIADKKRTVSNNDLKNIMNDLNI